jgi:DNA-binding response OmpR family regulator
MDLILAIDDDPNILKITEEQLNSGGYIVVTSSNPSSGIDLAKSGSPSLILLDIMMPNIDGFQVLERLQADEVASKIPVIMLSSKKDKDCVINAMKHGVADYLVKPCGRDLLLKKVETAIRYSKMKKESDGSDGSEHITISRGVGRTVLTFTASLTDRKFMENLKGIFKRGFLVMTVRDTIVLDLRPLKDLSKQDIPVLNAVFALFSGKPVYVIAGRHYGTIVENYDSPESVHLFISPGDMESEITEESGTR